MTAALRAEKTGKRSCRYLFLAWLLYVVFAGPAGAAGEKDARHYYLVGDWRRAAEAFEPLTGGDATEEDLLRAAEANYRSGKLDRAKSLAGRVLQKSESLDSRLLLVLIMAKERGPEAALQALKELKGSPKEEHRVLTAQCVIARMTDTVAALSYCDRATELNADDFWAWFIKGLIYEEREDFEKATKAYKEAVRINPLHAQAQNNLGYSYKERHFYAYAIGHYLKAIELMPDNPGFHYNVGNAYAHKDRVDEAFASYRKALEIDPEFAKAHYNMARMYLRKDMVNEAISEFRQYLRYATKAIYSTVATESSVEEEIEELERYLSSYGEVRVQREGMAR